MLESRHCLSVSLYYYVTIDAIFQFMNKARIKVMSNEVRFPCLDKIPHLIIFKVATIRIVV